MAGRTRTTKKLAQRIDLNYFKKLGRIPYWRRVASAGLAVLGLLGLGWYAVARNPKPYNAGPLAHAHSLYSKKCGECHIPQSSATRPEQAHWNLIWGRNQLVAADKACRACHDGPEHHAEHMPAPPCSDCHVEHRGAMRLASTSDRACRQCHDDLKDLKKNPPRFAINITGFDGGHPQFRAVEHPAARTVRFSHLEHSKKGLLGPGKTYENLTCDDCHRTPGTKKKLRFGTVDPSLRSLSTTPFVRPRGDYMAPVNYMEHCSACHPLPFDDHLQESAPHKKPGVVYDFIVDKLTDYIDFHPADIHIAAEPRLARHPMPHGFRDAQDWISQKLEHSLSSFIWPECEKCHDLNRRTEPLPVVTRLGSTQELTDTTIPVRRMPHANFDHEAHQMETCTKCHAKAPKDAKAAKTAKTAKNGKDDREPDLTLPGIAVCRQCHQAGDDKAEARCFECHTYHDWPQQKRVAGEFTPSQWIQEP